MNNYKKYKKYINRFLIVIGLIAIVLIYSKSSTIKTIVNILLMSFIFSYTLKPTRDVISERFNISKRISSIIIILVIILGMALLFYLIVPVLLREGPNLSNMLENIDSYIANIAEKIKVSDITFFKNMYAEATEEFNIFITNLTEKFIENLVLGFGNIISFAIVPVVTYYFLVDGDLIYNKVLLILPTEKRIVTKKALKNIDKILSRYIVSQLLLSGIIGVLTFIILICIGVRFALILAIINGIFNIIPYFGPIIGGVPAVFIALLDSPTKALWTFIAVFILQQIEGNILSPKITGDSTNMHPIIIIILLLIGEKLGGFAGMILAVPIGVIIKVIYDDINNYLF